MTVPTEPNPRRWKVLGVLIATLLIVVMDNTILNVVLKTLADPHAGLGATQGQLEWAINSYALIIAGLVFTFGVIGDRLGRRNLYVLGLALFGLSSLASAYAGSPAQLIWARTAMGVGAAMVMPQTLAIISSVFPPMERARAIGMWAASVGVGVAIGPIVGGVLLDHFWWGSVFLVNVPLALVSCVAVLFIVPESRNPQPGGFDPLGVLLSIVGLVSLTYGIIEGGSKAQWLQLKVLGPIVLGLVVLAWFLWHESRTRFPSLDVRLFKNARFSASVAALALAFFAPIGVFFLITFYLQTVRGYTPLASGLLLLPIAAAQLVVSPRTAKLTEKFGARAVCVGGLAMLAVALFSFLAVGADTPIWELEISFLLQGIGVSLVTPTATQQVMASVAREQLGAGSAVSNTARQVALTLGLAVLGSAANAYYRSHIQPVLGGLPDHLRSTAEGSIQSTHAIIGGLGHDLIARADGIFIDTVHFTAEISGVIALLSALVVWRWLPGRQAAAAPAAPAPAATAQKA